MEDKQKAFEQSFEAKLKEGKDRLTLLRIKSENAMAEKKLEFYKKIQAIRRENSKQVE
jgi:hypothetical protein